MRGRASIAHPAALPLALALVCALAGGAIADEPRVLITKDEATGRLTLDVDAPAADVLAALQATADVRLIFDGRIRDRVRLKKAALAPAEAVREVAAAADLVVEEQAGILLVRRARPADRLKVIRVAGDRFQVPERFRYEVVVLSGGEEEHVAARHRLSSLEATPGISAVRAGDLAREVLEEFARQRDAYQRVLAEAGLRLTLPRTLREDRVRTYVSLDEGVYYVEALPPAVGAVLTHLVFVLSAKDHRPILRLVAFEAPLK